MFYLIFGKDDFSTTLYFQKIFNYYLEKFKQKASFYQISLEKETLEEQLLELKNILKNNDLFALKKIIFIKNLFGFLNEKESKEILKTFENNILNSKNTVVLYEKEKPSKDIIDWFKKHNQNIKHFDTPTKDQFKSLIKKLSLKFQIQLSPLTINILMNCVYPDSWFLYQIIKKLSLINKKFIDEKTLKEYIALPENPYIFDFLDALFSKKPQKTFEVLEKIKKTPHYHPLIILKMIEKEIKNIIIVKKMKELKIKKLKNFLVSPFVFNKLSYLTSFITLEKLKVVYNLLSFYDRKIKDGSLEPQLALDLLLLNILFTKNYVSLSKTPSSSRYSNKNRSR